MPAEQSAGVHDGMEAFALAGTKRPPRENGGRRLAYAYLRANRDGGQRMRGSAHRRQHREAARTARQDMTAGILGGPSGGE